VRSEAAAAAGLLLLLLLLPLLFTAATLPRRSSAVAAASSAATGCGHRAQDDVRQHTTRRGRGLRPAVIAAQGRGARTRRDNALTCYPARTATRL
jgi:hypothetical protein